MSTKQIKTEIYGVKCAKDIKKIYKAWKDNTYLSYKNLEMRG